MCEHTTRCQGAATPSRVGSARTRAHAEGRHRGPSPGGGGPQKVERTPGPERRDDCELGPHRNLSEEQARERHRARAQTTAESHRSAGPRLEVSSLGNAAEAD